MMYPTGSTDVGVAGPSEVIDMPEYISSTDLGAKVFRSLFSSQTPLGNFCKAILSLQMMENPQGTSKQLWPCPIPTSVLSSGNLKSGRRQTRRSLRVVVREHLQLQLASAGQTQGSHSPTAASFSGPKTNVG